MTTPAPTRWQCQECREIVELYLGPTSTGKPEWRPMVRSGEGEQTRIVAIVHMRDPFSLSPQGDACGLAVPAPTEPDAIDSLTLDTVMGVAALGIRRNITDPLQAERIIAELHTHLTWGQSFEHEVMERAEALRDAVLNIRVNTAEGHKSREAMRRAFSTADLAIRRDDQWVKANPGIPSGRKNEPGPVVEVRYEGSMDAQNEARVCIYTRHERHLEERTELPLRDDIRKHSVAFNWGYEGSGPAQLALAMLAVHFRRRVPMPDDDMAGFREADGHAVRLYQRFKRRVIARLPQGTAWAITDTQVAEHVAAIEAEEIQPQFMWGHVSGGGHGAAAHLVNEDAFNPTTEGRYHYDARCGQSANKWIVASPPLSRCGNCARIAGAQP